MASKIIIAAIIFGIVAVLLGVFHGYSETQQGSVAPTSIIINAVGGTECEPSCFPAMTIIPNFLVAGIATIIIGIIILGWITVRIENEKSGMVLIILSIVFLLTGGGFLAPILSVISGFLVIYEKKK